MQALNARCKRDFYKAVHTSGQRKAGSIIWIVLHDEEAPTARAAAEWFQNPSSGGSAHVAVDDQECYRCLANEDIAWGAPGANSKGFHIEQAGFAKWSAVVWKSHLGTLKRAAYKAAIHCKKFGIPVRFVNAKGLLAGEPGITTHAECTKAFGGTHTDPGPAYPMPLFLWLCRRYRRQL
jgi:hypothetical protein